MRQNTPTSEQVVRRKPAQTVAMRGPVHSFNHDGMLVSRRRASRRAVPWHGLALVFVTVLLFKAAMHVNFGADGYQARVDDLAAGGAVQQVGAWLLTPDFATVWLSSTMQAFAR
ncbi:MAG: hypothetical protein GKR99_14540 [Rhodobacteraceae bacterium]|nr:hypothetical protein [Paracoccaceae bacterium]